MGVLPPFFLYLANISMDNLEDWTYDDFITYLLILGAQADLTITEDEKEVIEGKVGEDRYKKIKRFFDSQNDSQHIETVSTLYVRFKERIGGKDALVKELKGIVTLNNRTESVMDRYLMMMLKKIL